MVLFPAMGACHFPTSRLIASKATCPGCAALSAISPAFTGRQAAVPSRVMAMTAAMVNRFQDRIGYSSSGDDCEQFRLVLRAAKVPPVTLATHDPSHATGPLTWTRLMGLSAGAQ